MVIGRFLVADPQRIGGVEVLHATALDERLRHAVVCGGQEEAMVEANVKRARPQLAVPVRRGIAEAEVPFADGGRGVARALEHSGQGLGAGLDDGRAVRRRDAGALLPEGVRAREQREARGRAGGRAAIAAGEAHAPSRASRSMAGVCTALAP